MTEKQEYLKQYSKELKKGKKGPWRGLIKILNQINDFLGKTFFKLIQTMGLIGGILFKKFKHSVVPEGSKSKEKIEVPDLTENWTTEYEPMPKELEGSSEAQKFYNRTKARLLAD